MRARNTRGNAVGVAEAKGGTLTRCENTTLAGFSILCRVATGYRTTTGLSEGIAECPRVQQYDRLRDNTRTEQQYFYE